MSESESPHTEPESTKPADAKGQAKGRDLMVAGPEGEEGLLPCTLDQAIDQWALEGKRLTVNTFLRFIGAWGRDWQARVEENATLRERLAKLQGKNEERGRYKILVSLGQAGGTAVCLFGIGMVIEHHDSGWVLILVGATILGAALWANWGDPA
jgi:hypothetical protein